MAEDLIRFGTVSLLILASVFILYLLKKLLSKPKYSVIDEEPLSEYIKDKNAVLAERYNYLIKTIPRSTQYGVRLRNGVITYYRKNYFYNIRTYGFENYMVMKDQDYSNLCGMNLLFGLKQIIKEDLDFVLGNDACLDPPTREVLIFFQQEHGLDKEPLEDIRKQIVATNWRLARESYQDIVK